MKTQERPEGTPKSFRIRAENVPVQGIEIHEVLPADFTTRLIKEPKAQVSWTCLEATDFNCQVDHEADMLRLKGGGVFKVLHPCVRCMEDVQFDVSIDFNSRLLPRDQDPDHGREIDQEAFDDAVAASLLDDDEVVASYFDDGVIDLLDLLREQLFLEFPLYPCCDSPEAKNLRECDESVLALANMASPSIIEHPFANLKNWKHKDA